MPLGPVGKNVEGSSMNSDEPTRPDWFWEIAVAVNATFKGLLASQGQSGHICKRTIPISQHLSVRSGWPSVTQAICGSLERTLQNGDVVVVAEKIVAAALNRIGPRAVLHEPDPKTIPADRLPELAREWEERLGMRILPLHLLLADEYGDNEATLGVDDHNLRSFELASAIRETLAVKVDVIISDTDTGLDTRSPLIGTVTFGATPVGATRGVNLYEAMRCAVAAEFTRGHDKGIPVVVCVPAERRRLRSNIGESRGYPGALHISHEPGIAHA